MSSLYDKDTDKEGMTYLENMMSITELDEKIHHIERRMRLVNKRSPNFNEIMMKVDQILEDAPLAVKQIFELDSQKSSSQEFSQDYLQADLLWTKFGFQYDKIYPKYVVEIKQREVDEETGQEKGGEAEQDLEEEDHLVLTKNTNPFAQTMTVMMTEHEWISKDVVERDEKERISENLRARSIEE